MTLAMQVSVVICTLDRVARLRRCVEALAQQTASPCDFEILIVDNGSTDGTADVARTDFSGLANLRLVSEPRRGLARARNIGWQVARGEIVSFVDDDAIPAPDFVANVIRVFTTVSPRPGVVGGRIDALWEAPRPPWLTDQLAVYLTIVDWGPVAGPFPAGRSAVGCNMSIPRALLAEVGGFDVQLGRVGANLLSMEDSALSTAITAAGYDAYYDPMIRVQHCIPVERLTQAWMRRRIYWEGASLARQRLQADGSPRRRAELLARASAALVLKEPRAWQALATNSQDPAAFTVACMKLYRLGYLAGLCGLAR